MTQIDQTQVHVALLTTYGINEAEKPASEFPFRLEVRLRPDAAMLSFISSQEVLVIQGKTAEVLEELIMLNGYDTHCRLERMTLTGPDGVIKGSPDRLNAA